MSISFVLMLLLVLATAVLGCAYPLRHSHPRLIVWLAFFSFFLLAIFLLARALEHALRWHELPQAALHFLGGAIVLPYALWLLRLARAQPKRVRRASLRTRQATPHG